MANEVKAGASAKTGARAAAGEIEIGASVERVWRALTEAGELERWFPLQARVEPGEGGTIWMSWGNEFSGGLRILRWEPPHRLQTSWQVHGSDAATITDYALETVAGGRTRLRVVTSGFPDGADWDAWLEDTRRGWHFELRSLRAYLEQHDGRDRGTIYLRRRVALSVAEAWTRLAADDGLLPDVAHCRAVIDDSPPLQFAAQLDEPPGALLRVSVEPTGVGGAERDVTLWLSDWSGDAKRLAERREAWAAQLRALYPEGRDA